MGGTLYVPVVIRVFAPGTYSLDISKMRGLHLRRSIGGWDGLPRTSGIAAVPLLGIQF